MLVRVAFCTHPEYNSFEEDELHKCSNDKRDVYEDLSCTEAKLIVGGMRGMFDDQHQSCDRTSQEQDMNEKSKKCVEMNAPDLGKRLGLQESYEAMFIGRVGRGCVRGCCILGRGDIVRRRCHNA